MLGSVVLYSDVLTICNLSSFADRRLVSRRKIFKSIVNDSNHKLYQSLPAFDLNSRYSLSSVKAWLSFWKWPRVVLSANRLGTKKIQNGGHIKFIQKIMDIFVDIFPQFTASKVIVY